MKLPERALCVLAIVLLGTVGANAQAQQDDIWEKMDLKPLLPQFVPILPPLPPNSQLAPGAVGGASSSYSAPALQDSLRPPEAGPGLRFSVPR